MGHGWNEAHSFFSFILPLLRDAMKTMIIATPCGTCVPSETDSFLLRNDFLDVLKWAKQLVSRETTSSCSGVAYCDVALYFLILSFCCICAKEGCLGGCVILFGSFTSSEADIFSGHLHFPIDQAHGS